MNLFIYKIESIRQTFQSTSSQGHSCILMRNKEINTCNADERKYQIY